MTKGFLQPPANSRSVRITSFHTLHKRCKYSTCGILHGETGNPHNPIFPALMKSLVGGQHRSVRIFECSPLPVYRLRVALGQLPFGAGSAVGAKPTGAGPHCRPAPVNLVLTTSFPGYRPATITRTSSHSPEGAMARMVCGPGIRRQRSRGSSRPSTNHRTGPSPPAACSATVA